MIFSLMDVSNFTLLKMELLQTLNQKYRYFVYTQTSISNKYIISEKRGLMMIFAVLTDEKEINIRKMSPSGLSEMCVDLSEVGKPWVGKEYPFEKVLQLATSQFGEISSFLLIWNKLKERWEQHLLSFKPEFINRIPDKVINTRHNNVPRWIAIQKLETKSS